MEWFGTALRWLQLGSGLVLLGSAVLLLLVKTGRSQDSVRWRSALLSVAPWLVVILLLAATGLLMLQVISVSGSNDAAFQWSEWRRLLERTRYGTVWQLRQITALLLLLVLLCRKFLMRHFGERFVELTWLLLALLINAAAVFTGHGAVTEPLWLAGGSHALHLLAAGIWAGGLPALAYGVYLATRDDDPLFRREFATALRRFSRLALLCVVLITLSGLLITYLQFGAPTYWPARNDDVIGGLTTLLERSLTPLLGTSFGLQVLAKVLLLGAILSLAARIRWSWMPHLGSGSSGQVWQAMSRLIKMEFGVVLLILAFAASLTGTLPAAHDQLVWPLPLRLSPAATWALPWVPEMVLAAALLSLSGLIWLWNLIVSGKHKGRYLGRSRLLISAATLTIVAGLAAVLFALSVPAYPDTYRRTDVTYNAASVAHGATLFSRHCVACHGAGGKGDGPKAIRLTIRPADLTEPHTALHTAGDIFWWLTHGKQNTAMPGFADVMTEEERWDVVSFLRAFSAGYQARILTPQVVPGRPWLGPPDFEFATQSGEPTALSEYRERRTVLLVLYSLPYSAPRLAELVNLYPQLLKRDVEVIAILLPGTAVALPPGLPFVLVQDGAQEVANAYLL
ncbi:MAG: c-type cytochrome, partial [Sterolibacterium sp.]